MSDLLLVSSSSKTEINLPYVTATSSGPKHLVRNLTRAQFEQLADKLIQATLTPCKSAMKDAGMKPADIDEVILVGGSTRIPAIQKIVKDYFGKEGNIVLSAYTFHKSPLMYLSENPIFDVNKSPGRLSLFNEIFRHKFL